MDGFLTRYGLSAIFTITAIKACGVPLPPPTDALMLLAGAQAAGGVFVLWQLAFVLIVALVVGGAAEFWLARGPARGLIYHLGHHIGLTPVRLDAASAAVRRGGAAGIVVALLTPGVNATAVIACGLAGVPVRTFATGLVAGTIAEVVSHLAIGYAGGTLLDHALRLVPLPVLLSAAVLFLIAGLAIWVLLHRHHQPHLTAGQLVAAAAHSWHRTGTPLLIVWHWIWRAAAPERLHVPIWPHVSQPAGAVP